MALFFIWECMKQPCTEGELHGLERKVWIWAWPATHRLCNLGQVPLLLWASISWNLYDGLSKISEVFYIYWEIWNWKDLVNCKAPWKCSFIIIRTPILLPCLLKREIRWRERKFATYIISPVIFLKYFLLMSLMEGESDSEYLVKFTGIFLKD